MAELGKKKKNHEKHKTSCLVARLRFGPYTFHGKVRLLLVTTRVSLHRHHLVCTLGWRKELVNRQPGPLRHFNCVVCSGLIIFKFTYAISGFGGLEVACWPLVPKFAGSNPAEAVRFLRVNKNPQHVGGHGCWSVVIVVCCQIEVSATN